MRRSTKMVCVLTLAASLLLSQSDVYAAVSAQANADSTSISRQLLGAESNGLGSTVAVQSGGNGGNGGNGGVVSNSINSQANGGNGGAGGNGGQISDFDISIKNDRRNKQGAESNGLGSTVAVQSGGNGGNGGNGGVVSNSINSQANGGNGGAGGNGGQISDFDISIKNDRRNKQGERPRNNSPSSVTVQSGGNGGNGGSGGSIANSIRSQANGGDGGNGGKGNKIDDFGISRNKQHNRRGLFGIVNQ